MRSLVVVGVFLELLRFLGIFEVFWGCRFVFIGVVGSCIIW